jgi:molybdate transport system substrate-binding protein
MGSESGIGTPRRGHAFRALLLCVAVSLPAACTGEPKSATPAPVRVAAAADLALAFEELGRDFERQTGRPVTFSFGSTGLLAQQLRAGAPFDVFAAANVSFVDDVVAAGACDGATKAPYARGRIAVWTRRGSVAPPAAFEELADRRFTRIAIANPEHAPYGQAARQALQQARLFGTVESRLVFGENVRQALQLAETGNVEAAIVALALVVGDHDNPWLLVDERMHRPIDQALVVCVNGRSREGGRSFARFVNAAPGRAVMRRYGFLLPGEETAPTP